MAHFTHQLKLLISEDFLKVLVIDNTHKDTIMPVLPSDDKWKVFTVSSTNDLKDLNDSDAKVHKSAGLIIYLVGVNDILYLTTY